jgi:hypothetical protein
MTTRTIVTSHPGVACDVCGRGLLRGERPDVYLGGGQRRTVCELCAPRAAQEGWRRESAQSVAEHGEVGRRLARSRSLLGRLGLAGSERRPRPVRATRRESAVANRPADAEFADQSLADAGVLEEQWDDISTTWAGARGADDATGAERNAIDIDESAGDGNRVAADAAAGAPADVLRALEVFNAGEHPRRIAGVSRALGPACLKVAPLAGAPRTVAIVAAWELCWYRYEVDLDDEAAGARLAAEGTELEELPAADRVANAAADERGELALLAG